MSSTLAVELLRAHVNERAAPPLLLDYEQLERLSKSARNPKVRDLEIAALIHHQVCRLQIGMKLQRDLTFQLFIARKPDNSHSATPKDFDQRVTAEEFLSARALAHRRIRASTQIVSRSHFHSSSTKRRSSFLAAIASGRSSDQSWAWLNCAATSN